MLALRLGCVTCVRARTIADACSSDVSCSVTSPFASAFGVSWTDAPGSAMALAIGKVPIVLPDTSRTVTRWLDACTNE